MIAHNAHKRSQNTMTHNNPSLAPLATPALEQHYTVQEIAELWAVSTMTVRWIFRDQPGVLKPKGRKTFLSARAYESLRIPASVVARVHEERSAGFTLEVKGRRSRDAKALKDVIDADWQPDWRARKEKRAAADK
jgi:hypothetical protein